MPLELDTPDADATPAAPGRLAALVAARQRVTDKDRQFFTEQLSMLLDTGTALHAAHDVEEILRLNLEKEQKHGIGKLVPR